MQQPPGSPGSPYGPSLLPQRQYEEQGLPTSPFLQVHARQHETYWAPQSYISPCFNHFKSDDGTVRCLTKTQVALHEQKQLLQKLAAQAAQNQEEWERMKEQLVGPACVLMGRRHACPHSSRDLLALVDKSARLPHAHPCGCLGCFVQAPE